VPHLARIALRRTSVLLVAVLASTLALAAIGLEPPFWAAVTLLVG
jgi:hypothetical protein